MERSSVGRVPEYAREVVGSSPAVPTQTDTYQQPPLRVLASGQGLFAFIIA